MSKISEVVLADSPNKTKFISVATLCLDKKIEDFVSVASIDGLKSLIPEGIAINENLVPFVGNLWVANLANGNGDTLNTETSLAYYKLFEHTKIDLEHDFETVFGHIISVHLTSFDDGYKQGNGSEILSEDDVRGTDKLFNVAIVGVLYKECAPAVIEKIIQSNDKGSDNYLKCSLSWETKFSDFNILLGHSVGNGRIVTDAKKILELTRYLKGNKGSGKLSDGTPVNRLIIGEISPMGAGVTLNPAAKVAGIIVPDEVIEEYQETEDESIKAKQKNNNMKKHSYGDCPECGDNTNEDTIQEDDMITCGACKKTSKAKMWKKDEDLIASANQIHISAQLKDLVVENNEKFEKIISHLEKTDVTMHDNKNIDTKIIKKMKFIESFASFEKVTDEDLQKGEVSVANLRKVLEDEIKKANDQYVGELNAKETAIANAQKETEDAKKIALEAKASAEKLQEKITQLENSLAAQEADQKFQIRMNALNDKYELDEAYREIVASDVAGLSDEDFDKYAKKFAVIAKHLDKEVIKASQAKGEKKDVKEVVKAALDNADLEKETVPSTQPVEEDKNEKLKASFSREKLIAK